MKIDYIALAIPFFLVSMAIEITLCVMKGKKYYRFNDTITNLSQGLGQQAIGVGLKVIYLYCYTWAYDNFAFTQFQLDNPWHWTIAILTADICYYWFHRISHRMNLFVGAHVVHHHSEEYNLSVALRQSWFTRGFVWIFYLPMAVMGVPPTMYIAIAAIILIYQFWIHSRFLPKMGILEYILVTPSHHRVHHGRNPQYVDKNYGAIFIWWDMLFGSFEKEDEEIVYGVITPIKSWNPVWGNLEYYVRLWRQAKEFPRFTDRLKIWFMSPEWRPVELGGNLSAPPVDVKSYQKYDTHRDTKTNVLLALQFSLCLALMGHLFINRPQLSEAVLAVIITLVVWGLANIGGIQESRRWSFVSQLLFFGALTVFGVTHFVTGVFL